MGEPDGTHRRLAALLVVAAAAGGVATLVGTATAVRAFPQPLADLPPASPYVARRCPLPKTLRPAFVHAARDTGLPLSMLVAVGKVESNLEVNARSEAGARGLLQLMPATAAALQLNIDNPGTNVLAGARYLSEMLERFSSTDLALAAYNAGPTAVQEAGGAPSQGVETYVQNVTDLWRSLAGCV